MSYTKAALDRIKSFHKTGCVVTGAPEWDVHHITDCGRRMGNEFTIPLHPWLHRGVCEFGMTKKQMTEMFGPSLAYSKKDFVARFGTELELLEKVNELLKGDMK